ncbi:MULTISPECIES: substrate-binding domain-containing protein [unclassified Breznakia]|uniref:substrate-binding domain-containing protein n=1 Tax=unclassified Breznakia TaxID=2623764 RepID=UPI002475AD55|nr:MULTISPECIES: substrate-binding domain-containing protein [unclassified Breznakia]MDH6366251.1 ribose transport system substrate-binding protein [Breznakia sp. PH1-1]MDH6403344.1 ribose transport system substrate-binding protein [Breznakia sp. PF1-11]MDH6411053.1 ribose transport system substrate-binding protein [Breznakia sp. PFB1-11]MDH6413417.1 ribose transport system substrate-binding protein [Breznakia sp. PFB1-14]MDH6416182.1 ribose transport system substrate-binding protein [Breznaki
MRKVIFFIILLLVSCTPSKSNNETEEYYFLFATPLKNHEVWLSAKSGFEDACKELNVNCEWTGPSTISLSEMEDTLRIGVLQGAHGIITQGVISEEAIMYANENEVPLVFVDADKESSNRLSFLGKDFNKQANLLLNDIEKRLGKETHLKIAIQVAEIDFDIAQKQIQEIREVFQLHPGGYHIQSISESKSESLRAKQEWQEVFASTDVNVAINFAGESAITCGEVAKSLHLKDQILVYGVDDMPQTIEGIQNGIIDGSVVTSFYEYGYQAVHQLYAFQKTGKLPSIGNNSIKLMLVNQDNYQTYKKELSDVSK